MIEGIPSPSSSVQWFRHIYLDVMLRVTRCILRRILQSTTMHLCPVVDAQLSSSSLPLSTDNNLLVKGRRKKKRFFLEIFPKYGWVGVQIPKLSVTFTNHYFSAQKFPNVGGWGSQNPKPNPNFGWNLLNAFNNSQIKPEFFGGLPWATFQRK